MKTVNFKYFLGKLGNPFSIVFVYPKDGEPFCLKGGIEEINRFLDGYKMPAVVHVTYWRLGHHSDSKRIINVANIIVLDELLEFSEILGGNRRNHEKKKYFIYEKLSLGNAKLIKAIRRFPRKWIKELNPYTQEFKEKNKKRLIRIV